MQLLSQVFSIKMLYRQLITTILSIYKNFSLGEVVILRRRKDLRQRRVGSEKDAGAHHDPPVMPHFPFGTAIIS